MFTDWRGVFAIMGVLMICTAGAFLLWGRGGNTRTDAPSFKGCGVLLKNPASWIVALLMAASMIGEFSIYSILQIFLVSAAGFGPEEANLGLSISRLAMPVIVIAAGWAADRFNAKRTVRACFLLHAVALCLMSVDASVSRIPALCGVFLQAASMAFVFPPLFKVFAQCFSADEQPILLSLTMPLAGLISAGGIPFFIGYCGEYYTFGLAFLTIAAMSVASAVSVAYLKNRE